MYTLGILIVVVSIFVLLADPVLEKLTANAKVPIDLIKNNRKWILYLTTLVGFLLIFSPFVHNSAGERTYVQDPFLQTEKVIFSPGYH
jgi:hypothetical protein